MKRLLFLLAGILLVGILVWYTVDLMSGKGRSDQQTEAWDFAIKDTASVDRIILTESSGSKIELIRRGKVWTDENGGCIQQVPVTNILDAAFNIRLKSYVSDGMVKTVTNRMASAATEVKFYVKGELFKTWYVGYPTPDHYGTFMLLNSEAEGRSDKPVIMEIQGLNGIITPRFFSDRKKWACTQVIAVEGRDIAMVDVKHIGRPERNFHIENQGSRFLVTSNGKPLPRVDTSLVMSYLNNYRNIHFEFVNSDLSAKQVDSVKKSTPFCVLTLKTKKNEITKLRLFRRASDTPENGPIPDNSGEMVTYDQNRFWCETPTGELVKCQYFVFDKLIMGNVYFQ